MMFNASPKLSNGNSIKKKKKKPSHDLEDK